MMDRAKRYRDLRVPAVPGGMQSSAFSEAFINKPSKTMDSSEITFKKRDVELAVALDQILQKSLGNINCMKQLKSIWKN
jgi:hypothetical protein